MDDLDFKEDDFSQETFDASFAEEITKQSEMADLVKK